MPRACCICALVITQSGRDGSSRRTLGKVILVAPCPTINGCMCMQIHLTGQITAGVAPNPGPGIGNIHVSTARIVSSYFSDEYSQCLELQLNLHDASDTAIVTRLTDDDNSIRVIAATVRQLADYRFGSNGQPLTSSHANLAAWTITDAVAIWHGYRYGVPDVSFRGQGFRSLDNFQNRTVSLEELLNTIVIGTGAYESASNSVPIFEQYFQQR